MGGTSELKPGGQLYSGKDQAVSTWPADQMAMVCGSAPPGQIHGITYKKPWKKERLTWI